MAAPPDLGSRFAPVERLAAARCTETWLVEDAELGHRVVAKVLSADASNTERELFAREHAIARRLDHPNIVAVSELHESHEHRFFTMPFFERGDIAALRGRPGPELVPVFRTLAEALDHAHSLGIIHRDLKTSNVLLDDDGLPHLIDFGAAGDDLSGVTGGGSRHAVSPQQLLGEAPSASDDIYGLGTLFYELVSGYPPFWPDLTDDRILHTRPEPPRALEAPPPGLTDLILRMLEKQPGGRPPTMASVARELARCEQRADPPVGPPDRHDPKTHVRLTPPPRAKVIRPASATTSEPRSRARSSRGVRAASHRAVRVAVVSGLALTLFVVFFLLPRWIERYRPRSAPRVPAAVTSPSGSKAAMSAEATLPDAVDWMERARQALDHVTRLEASVIKRGVEFWGGDAYAESRQHIEAGDALFKTGDHQGATVEYDRAADLLHDLAERTGHVFRAALEDGGRALAAGDSRAAETAFRLALAVTPGNPAAEAGLRRAAVLDQLLQLLAEGEEADRSGDAERAATLFRRAVELDPLSSEARAALTRSRQHVQSDAYNDEIGEGLAALDRGEYERAREAFLRAAELRPGSRESDEGLARVDAAIRGRTIARHQADAIAAEEAEDWSSAIASYEAALSLDPTLAFAVEGLDRSRSRAKLSDQIEYHLAHADRLQAPSVLEQASQVLDDARQIRHRGPALTLQIERLEKVIETASTPVTVELRSDNLTDVVVYQVGRLGSFSRQTLDLRPGTYTVVGAREGYRDVRLRLVVRHDQPTEPLVVRCEEKL